MGQKVDQGLLLNLHSFDTFAYTFSLLWTYCSTVDRTCTSLLVYTAQPCHQCICLVCIGSSHQVQRIWSITHGLWNHQHCCISFIRYLGSRKLGEQRWWKDLAILWWKWYGSSSCSCSSFCNSIFLYSSSQKK